MVDVSLIAGAVSGLRVAASLAGDLVTVRDQQVLQQKVIELQRTILDAQSSALAAQGQQQDLLDQIRSLTQQLEEATAWQTTLSRYRLEEFGDKTFSYRLREEHRTEEPDHLICSKCVVERRRSVLNFSHGRDGEYYWDYVLRVPQAAHLAAEKEREIKRLYADCLGRSSDVSPADAPRIAELSNFIYACFVGILNQWLATRDTALLLTTTRRLVQAARSLWQT